MWSNPPRALDINRANWATYANISKMYDLIYPKMVESGVATKLDTPIWMDQDGNTVQKDDPKRFGDIVEYVITQPQYVLFVDEVGSNTNMKKDKRQGGKRKISIKGQASSYQGSTGDTHYTVMCFTAST